MTHKTQDTKNKIDWSILASILVFIFILLPPVKRWLNAIPHLWSILYPLLAGFSFIVVIRLIRNKESLLEIIQFCVLCLASFLMSFAVLTSNAALHTAGRYTALAFIVFELGIFLYDIFKKDDGYANS